MKRFISILCAAFLLAPAAAMAAEPTKEDAIAMVNKALALAKSGGKNKLIAEVNAKNPDFVQGELYIVVSDMAGIRIAHPLNPKQIGRSMGDAEDVDGKPYGKDMLAAANSAAGTGWVDYKFKNPVSGKVEAKTTYVAKGNGFFVIAGIYK